MEYEIVCVDHGIFPHGGSKIIRFGIRAGGRTDVIDKASLMHRMTTGDRFFVKGGGRKAYLTRGTSPQGHGYVETEADDTLLDNLLSLPLCTVNDHITYGTGVSDPNDVDAGADGGGDPGGPDGGAEDPDDPD